MPTTAENVATPERGTAPLAVGVKRFTDKESGRLGLFGSAGHFNGERLQHKMLCILCQEHPPKNAVFGSFTAAAPSRHILVWGQYTETLDVSGY